MTLKDSQLEKLLGIDFRFRPKRMQTICRWVGIDPRQPFDPVRQQQAYNWRHSNEKKIFEQRLANRVLKPFGDWATDWTRKRIAARLPIGQEYNPVFRFKTGFMGTAGPHEFFFEKTQTMVTGAEGMVSPEQTSAYHKIHGDGTDPRILPGGHLPRKIGSDEFEQFRQVAQGRDQITLFNPRPFTLGEQINFSRILDYLDQLPMSSRARAIIKTYPQLIDVSCPQPGIFSLLIFGLKNTPFPERLYGDKILLANDSKELDTRLLLITLPLRLFNLISHGAR